MAYEGSGTSITDAQFLLRDRLGSIVGATDYQGTLEYSNAYSEYGQNDTGNEGRFRFTGQVWLPELGLYYYKARMYSPRFGRFMQTDPIGYADGMNMYRYVGNDPVNWVDPLGQNQEQDGEEGGGKPCPEGHERNDKDICVQGKRKKPSPHLGSGGFGGGIGFSYGGGGDAAPLVDEIVVTADRIKKKIGPFLNDLIDLARTDEAQCVFDVVQGGVMGALGITGVDIGKAIGNAGSYTKDARNYNLPSDKEARAGTTSSGLKRTWLSAGRMGAGLAWKAFSNTPGGRAAGGIIGAGVAASNSDACASAAEQLRYRL